MIEGLQLSIPRRMGMIKVTLVLSLIVSMLLSLNLWGGDRHFPYTPVLDTETVLPPYDYLFLIFAVLSWIASLILRMQRVFLFLSFVICVWLALLDINRLQPWFYIYNALLAVFIFYNGRVDDPNKYTSFFIVLQIIVASVYFYMGLSQLNENFVDREFLNTISPLKKLVSPRQFALFVKLGHVVPYMLMFIGVGLMISAIRYLAITLAVIMHIFLLAFFLPSAHQLNIALWLSNLVFSILILLLFSGKTKQRYFSPTFLLQMPLFYIVIALFVIMPMLNRRDQWPDFLSSNFNSGQNKEMSLQISQKIYDKLPLYDKHFYTNAGGRYLLDYKVWSREELNAECFPDEKVFNSLYLYLVNVSEGDVKEIELKSPPPEALLRKPEGSFIFVQIKSE